MDQIGFYENKLQFEIDSWDLNALLQEDAGVVVVDTRSLGAYTAAHIPGAISLPHREMNTETTVDFARDVLYVTYCDGIGCNASTKGALNMARLGFTVKELIGGLDWWKRENYPVAADKTTTERGEGGCGCR